MAWPPLSSRSEPGSCSTHWPSDLRRHRRRKQSSSPSSVPSSTLLSFLASLASATTANASPAPPSFLCPSIESDSTIPPWCRNKRSPPLEKVHPPNRQGSGRSKLRRVPDRFVEGTDGIWRRVESYTLYGVTAPNPKCDDENCPPTRPISSVGVPLNGTALPPRPFDIQLPPGWKAAPKATNNRTTMILAVSLALSLFICFLIIICLFWRKGLLNKKRSQDIEAKNWRRNRLENHTSEEQRNTEVEKEAKNLQKIWARASARWKANARYSLRQRTGKRFFTRSHHQSTASIVDDSRSHLAAHTSRPPSVSAIQNQPLEERIPDQESQNLTSRPSSPPAYHTDPQIPISSPEQMTGSVSGAPHLSRRASQPVLYSCNAHPHLPNLDLFPAAHVATDDKTLLARLADLASAPPNETDTVANMSLTQVSAPEDLEFGVSIVTPTSMQMDRPPLVSLFPPPPSKERLAAAERLEYTFAYDNLENTEPEPEPSAPPFEESSAMPPLNESMPFPSAPPIIHDEDQVWCPSATYLPSAPTLDDVSQVISYEEVPEKYHESTTNTQ